MAWVNFRDVADRFNHVDGELVSTTVAMRRERSTVDVVLRFYPWWEHPLYVTARDQGKPWRITAASSEGERDVCVRAIDPCEVRLSRQHEISDIAFVDDHPLLWPLGPLQTIYANSEVSVESLFAGLVDLGLPYAGERDFRAHIGLPEDTRPPFGISVPSRLYQPLLSVLRRLGVRTLAQEPATMEALVLFLFGDADYVIARDFQLDVPEFTHKPEWFQP